MKNSADQGGYYPQRPRWITPAKAELNNCFIIDSKYFPVLN